MPTRMEWNDDEVKAQIEQRSTVALQRATALGAGAVRQEITAQDLIDTGNLLNSIDGRIVAADRGRVATNVFYGIYLEYGTRFMPARAFMRRGMEHDANNIRRLIAATMRSG